MWDTNTWYVGWANATIYAMKSSMFIPLLILIVHFNILYTFELTERSQSILYRIYTVTILTLVMHWVQRLALDSFKCSASPHIIIIIGVLYVPTSCCYGCSFFLGGTPASIPLSSQHIRAVLKGAIATPWPLQGPPTVKPAGAIGDALESLESTAFEWAMSPSCHSVYEHTSNT